MIVCTDCGFMNDMQYNTNVVDISYTGVQRDNTRPFVSVTVCNILSKCIVSYSKVIV